MSEPVRPAMTAEEWAQGRVLANGYRLAWPVNDGCVAFIGLARPTPDEKPYLINQREAHALAALCLHGQPFGFTRQDVADLRQAAVEIECESYADHEAYLDRLSALADRIEALLPPEGT